MEEFITTFMTKFIKNTGVKIVDKIQTDGTKTYIDEENLKKKDLSLRESLVNRIMDKYSLDVFLNLKDKIELNTLINPIIYKKNLIKKYIEKTLTSAVEDGHAVIVKSLIDTGVVDMNVKYNQEYLTKSGSIAIEGFIPIIVAVTLGKLNIVKLLLESGVDKEYKDEFGNTLLHLAVENGHADIVQILLDAGANKDVVGSYGCTPMHIAADKGYTEIEKLLLDAGAKVDKKFGRALPNAAGNGDIAKVLALIAEGGNVDVKTIHCHYTPLHLAAENGHGEIVQILLDAGADKDVKTVWGKTPLQLAAENGYTDIVQILLDAGADKDVKDRSGYTPLNQAAWKGHINIVELLLDAGVDKEVKDEWGRTPLHFAADRGHIKIVMLLLNAGVDKDVKDQHGKTPLDLALARGYTNIGEILN